MKASDFHVGINHMIASDSGYRAQDSLWLRSRMEHRLPLSLWLWSLVQGRDVTKISNQGRSHFWRCCHDSVVLEPEGLWGWSRTVVSWRMFNNWLSKKKNHTKNPSVTWDICQFLCYKHFHHSWFQAPTSYCCDGKVESPSQGPSTTVRDTMDLNNLKSTDKNKM